VELRKRISISAALGSTLFLPVLFPLLLLAHLTRLGLAKPNLHNMQHSVFDPVVVKANLRLSLKAREKKPNDHKNKNEWLVDWSTDWTEDAFNKTVQ
jgi:hypothetical protein